MWDGRGGGGRELHHETVAVAGGGEARGGKDMSRQREFRGRGGMDGCVMKGTEVGEEDDVGFQLLSSSSVAVSTSQDFDDNATITAFFSKPMAQSLSILRVYSGLETGAPA